MLVVGDTSPLACLAHVGLLGALSNVYGEVLVPKEVWTELVERWPDAPGVADLRAAAWLRVSPRDGLVDPGMGLDAGETAAILLAEAERADLLLIDERRGRRVAAARGLQVRGTLSVLVAARELGHIDALAPALSRLQAAGFRASPQLFRAALVRVGEWGGER